MQYVAVFYVKNKDTCFVRCFDADTDSNAHKTMQKVKKELETPNTIITGEGLFAIDHSVCTN